MLIISHTPHYSSQVGIVGWGPTIREIDQLSSQFEEVVHIAPLYKNLAPVSALPYQSSSVRFRGVLPAGGEKFKDKISVIQNIPVYIRVILQEMRRADIVHVRCPANISLVALIILAFKKQPKYRWVKYAGNWKPNDMEAHSYTFQRWFLQKNLHRGVVTINGEWEKQSEHIHSFYNPSLSEEELVFSAETAKDKEISIPVQLLFVGRLDSAKGVGRIFHIAVDLQRKQIPFKLNLIGDGPEKDEFIQQVNQLGLSSFINFRGWLSKNDLWQYYQKAHFILFPSSSEGWPKVLSEAMAYGVVPLASTVSSIPQMLEKTGAGFAISNDNLEMYVLKIIELSQNQRQWKELSRAGVKSAQLFTYKTYLENVRTLFKDSWNIQLSDSNEV